MKIGITGASGNLGSYLKKILKNDDLVYFKKRIENKNDVRNWIRENDFDSIIHLAAIAPTAIVNNDKKRALKINFQGTKNIVNAINRFANKKIWFFYSSTSHVYKFNNNAIKERNKTNPSSYYGRTKLLGENYIVNNSHNFTPCVGRIFSYTSIEQSNKFIIPAILKKFHSKRKKINFQNLNHIRDFLPIEDICLAIKTLIKKKGKGIYNICSNKKTNLQDIVLKLNTKYKKEITFSNNSGSTILFGCNKKIRKIGWKPLKIKYTDYLLKKDRLI